MYVFLWCLIRCVCRDIRWRTAERILCHNCNTNQFIEGLLSKVITFIHDWKLNIKRMK